MHCCLPPLAQVGLKLLLDRVMDEDGCRGDVNGPFDEQTVRERREELQREKVRRRGGAPSGLPGGLAGWRPRPVGTLQNGGHTCQPLDRCHCHAGRLPIRRAAGQLALLTCLHALPLLQEERKRKQERKKALATGASAPAATFYDDFTEEEEDDDF